jgi:hypothetical protein
MALEAEILAMKSKTYCAYCGKEYAIDTDAMLVAEHIATCEKHPMRAVEARAESAEAQMRELVAECGMLRRVVANLEAGIDAQDGVLSAKYNEQLLRADAAELALAKALEAKKNVYESLRHCDVILADKAWFNTHPTPVEALDNLSKALAAGK